MLLKMLLIEFFLQKREKSHLKIDRFLGAFVMALCFVLSLDATVSSSSKQENKVLPKTLAICHPESRIFDIFANLIVWTAKEAGADAWAEVIISNSSMSSNDILEVHFGWDPGFRIGIGYERKADQWSTQAFYTRFHTHGKDRIASNPGTVHSTFLGNFYVDNPLGLGLSGPSYQRANIDWTIHFDMFDWELGCNYCVSKSLLFRPFLGLKGGWIDQSIRSVWENPDFLGFSFFTIGIEKLKNDFWGVGPITGIDTKWILFSNQRHFYLFGDFSGALMWGHWSFSDVFENDLSQQVTVDLQNIKGGASMLRTFMGFGWNTNFCKNQYRFSTKIGYEMQFWLDQLQFYSFTGGRLVNELTLQGGTLELCFEF